MLVKVCFWMPAMGAMPTNFLRLARHSSWVSLGPSFFFSLTPLCFRFSSLWSTLARLRSACCCLKESRYSHLSKYSKISKYYLHKLLDFFSFLFGQAVFEQWVIFVIIFAVLIGILVRWEIGIFEGNRGSVRRHFISHY